MIKSCDKKLCFVFAGAHSRIAESGFFICQERISSGFAVIGVLINSDNWLQRGEFISFLSWLINLNSE